MKTKLVFASLFLFVCFFGMPKSVAGDADQLPVGFFDAADCSSLVGWACDPDDYAAALQVYFYADGPAGTGSFVGATTANLAREAAVGNLCGGYSAHGFSFPVPASLFNGNSRAIYAYAIDTAPNNSSLIAGGPKAINCAADIKTNNAEFVSQVVPAFMNPGRVYPIIITMRNAGTTTWSDTDNYHLGSQNHQDNTVWSFGRVNFSDDESILPGATKKFVFNVTAPAVPGAYNFQWRMVQDGVEWFGDKTVNAAITVAASNFQPASLWLTRTAATKGVWTLDSGYRAAGSGNACDDVPGWANTKLATTKTNADGSISVKTIQAGCSRPWGSQQGKIQVLNGYWTSINSNNFHDGMIKEEVMPDPGLIFAPLDVIPDGQWHMIVSGCYQMPFYVNYMGGDGPNKEGGCYDAVCQTAENCPIYHTLSNVRYIVYDTCNNFTCDGQPVPVKFYQKVNSVMRISYDAVNGCGGAKILTEEQWFLKNYGWFGFYNTNSGYAPTAVDLYAVDDEQSCLPFWDNFCPNNNECLATDVCVPGAVSGCKVCQSDGSGWRDDNTKCGAKKICQSGICTADSSCVPNCVGKTRGDDGCGGNCGTAEIKIAGGGGGGGGSVATGSAANSPAKMTRAEILVKIQEIKKLLIQLIAQLIAELQKQLAGMQK